MNGFTAPWQPGAEVRVRGRRWTVLEQTLFADCAALRLEGTGSDGPVARLTLLLPFDRPLGIERAAGLSVVRPRRWLHTLRRHCATAFPGGGLRAAAAGRVDILPYQLEPALAMLRHGASRLLIADAVGLGKTIQAALIIAELARRESCRVLVAAPAGLLQQWVAELNGRFGLDARIADAAWLGRVGHDVPPGENPWALPGIFVASLDFLKRPEVLQTLENVRWDLVVADEAHGAAPATARRAAIDAVASRSARVILLTATPPAGDAGQWSALCAIGDRTGADAPIVVFQRSKAADTPPPGRRTVMLPVRLTGRERRLHRLLESYTAGMWRDSAGRIDQRARLTAIVLKKRALSSAASLSISVRRRLVMLSATSPAPPLFQLGLPLEPGPDDDLAPDDVLGHPGLADARSELRWLTAIARASRQVAGCESKTRALLRLLGRLKRSVLVFTEFRDTLERLADAVAAAGHPVVALHGGLSRPERIAVLRRFEERGGILMATDAASEGLNLHHRCHVVIHFELPWTAVRLEQRAGRVDRMGQSRRVHEIVLVAADTAEGLVIAPLVRRVRAGRSASPSLARLAGVLDESRMATAVMEGLPAERPAEDPFNPFGAGVAARPSAALAAEAAAESCRLQSQRAWRGSERGRFRTTRVPVSSVELKHSVLPQGACFVFSIALRTVNGEIVAQRPVCCSISIPARERQRGDAGSVRRRVGALVTALTPAMRLASLTAAAAALAETAGFHHEAIEARLRRERVLAAALPSAAKRLVQAGLFDRREILIEAVRYTEAATLREESRLHVAELERSRELITSCELEAVILMSRRRQ